MNQGNFEEYNEQESLNADYNELESEQNNEVYQMYEEMMNLVQEGMKDKSSEFEEEGSSEDETRTNNSRP